MDKLEKKPVSVSPKTNLITVGITKDADEKLRVITNDTGQSRNFVISHIITGYYLDNYEPKGE